MRYAYYPGCSGNGIGRAYEESLLAVFESLGSVLDELDDWNCCGATAWTSVDEKEATALAARNLALTENSTPGNAPVDLVAACSGCYRAMLKAEDSLREHGEVAEKVTGALRTVGLDYEGRARVRHPIDILVNDIGLERIREATVRPLEGLKIASYYGCLLVRPYAPFDDIHVPTSMEKLMEAVGAEPIEWPSKTRCCGGSCYCGGPVIGVMPEATMQLSFDLLKEAKRLGADAIATICPLCQFNLEGFQDRMARRYGQRVHMTVGFVTQFLGLALGLDERALGIKRMMRWDLPEPRSVGAEGGAHVRA